MRFINKSGKKILKGKFIGGWTNMTKEKLILIILIYSRRLMIIL